MFQQLAILPYIKALTGGRVKELILRPVGWSSQGIEDMGQGRRQVGRAQK